MKQALRPEAIDCHLHAGLERRETLEEVFEHLAREGREVVGLVDHAEVYLRRPPGWAAMSLAEARARAERADVAGILRSRLKGPEVFYRASLDAIDTFAEGTRAAVGLEVSGAYLDKIDPGWLEGAQFLGICAGQPVDRTTWGEELRWGEHMAGLVSKADRLRGGRELGLVLHHPFRWRLLELAHETEGELPEAGGFTLADAEITARALSDAGAVAEVNFASWWHLAKDERLVPLARDAFGRMRDAGASFSIGSDFHAVTGLPCDYEPSKALDTFGLGPEDIKLPAPFAGP
ncbi:MAG: hypothetical protein ACYTFI_11590 [Planctomycetota bacterium]